ncbi:hypothetical protein [Bacillus taeanensis]|uniref:Uncharacterized protein n=1 Tax=Bacillus taeanensis TaxID=273032 RepID=A0A366Y3F2_9BACI|nr:hypothetical protein [Bacillus taeanensis]RBW70933.1 hypothetical protein DS031_02750 [Bacillus taeanensis]
MFSLRGDAHKFYLKLKRSKRNNYPIEHFIEMKEIEEIETFYKEVESPTLKTIRYRMIKEKKGSGIIPIYITSTPWLMLAFAKPLQKFLLQDGSELWLVFVLTYMAALTVSVIVHFKEKAWAAVHIEIIEEVLKKRGEMNSS